MNLSHLLISAKEVIFLDYLIVVKKDLDVQFFFAATYSDAVDSAIQMKLEDSLREISFFAKVRDVLAEEK